MIYITVQQPGSWIGWWSQSSQRVAYACLLRIRSVRLLHNMQCLSKVLVGSVGITALFGAAVWALAQNSSTGAPMPPSLKICSVKNPPPCASAPKAIYLPDPEYSQKARKKKIQGVVVLETTVGTDGLPRDIHVIQSAEYGLNEQAVKTLRKWKFEPGTIDGKPVPVSVTVEIDFRLY